MNKIKSYIKSNQIKSNPFRKLYSILDDKALIILTNFYPILFGDYFLDDFSNPFRQTCPHLESFEVFFRDKDAFIVLMINFGKH